jgi:hypothetical protein
VVWRSCYEWFWVLLGVVLGPVRSGVEVLLLVVVGLVRSGFGVLLGVVLGSC